METNQSRTGREPAPVPPPPSVAGDPLLQCLSLITRHYGKPVAEAEILRLCSRPELGMTPEGLRLAGRRLGYKVATHRPSREGLQSIPAPYVLIARDPAWHCLVLEQDGEELLIQRPTANCRERVRAEEMLSVAKEALALRPEHMSEEAGQWRRLLRQRIRGAVRELLLASLLINLFVLAPPLFLMTVFNKVISHGALDTLHVLVIGMIAVYGFDVMLRGIRGYISSHTTARLDAMIGSEVVHRLFNLPYRHFETTSIGIINERLRQLDVIRQFFAGQMPLVIVDLGFVVLFLGVLFVISPKIAWIVTAVIPVFVLLSLICHRAQKRLVEDAFVAQAAKTSLLAESVNNAITVKSLGLEGEVERRWGERIALSAGTGFKASNVASLVGALGNGLQHVAILGIVYIGALEVIAGAISLGALIAANLLAARILGPARKIVSAWSQLQEVRAAFNRLDAIMEQAPESTPGELAPVPPLTGRIDLEAVSLRLAADRPPVLQDVTLTIPSGSIVALVGPSGAGKTTLVRSLYGLARTDQGRILFDGTDVAHIPLPQLRREIAVVPQEIQLFSGTVRENIAIGMQGCDPQRVVAAAKFVGAHDFIERLPRGYDTPLGELGGCLSAGQKQLLCVARAVIRNPRILVLDEATSALDAESEKFLMANLKRAHRGRTIILVSHRPAPVSIANLVYRVENGRVTPVERRPRLVRLPGEGAGRMAPEEGRPPAGQPPAEGAAPRFAAEGA